MTTPQPPVPTPRLAWLLDDWIRLPGGYRIGLDGLLGLIPGVGDLLGGLLASLILLRAARLRVPGVIMLTLGLNIVVDCALGSIPLLGDLFDFVWKANRRNVQLLDLWERDPEAAKRLCLESNLGAFTAFGLGVALLGYITWETLQMFFAAIA